MGRVARVLLAVCLGATCGLSLDGKAAAADYDYKGIPAYITPFDSRYRRVQRYLESRDPVPPPKSTASRKSDFPNHIAVLREYLKRASRFKHIQEGEGRGDTAHGDPSSSPVRKGSSWDYWQLPEETEGRGAGDCEDKAIWLYARLIQIGVENVRLVVGKYRVDQPAYHAWVVCNLTGKIYILDPTINDGVWEARRYPKGFYKPVYSYSKDGRWSHTEAYWQLLSQDYKNQD